MNEKPKILLTNDDGIDAEGIQALRRALRDDYDVLVVAPVSERSGSGCALTVGKDMAITERTDEAGNVWGYAVDGTPADCVKFAVIGMADYQPNLVLSGANRGSNLGNSVFYSGTVAATIEASMRGLKAMAVSVHYEGGNPLEMPFHFDTAARVAKKLIPWLLDQNWLPRSLWNLNLPNKPIDEIKGVRFAHQGTSYFIDNFTMTEERDGVPHYCNSGDRIQLTPEPSHSDDLIVEASYAALSLLRIDLTVEMPPAAREALEREWDELVFKGRAATRASAS